VLTLADADVEAAAVSSPATLTGKALTCCTRRSISNGFGKKASTPKSSGWRLG